MRGQEVPMATLSKKQRTRLRLSVLGNLTLIAVVVGVGIAAATGSVLAGLIAGAVAVGIVLSR
jgi:hypothetical protein